MIEQPVAAGSEEWLRDCATQIALCADESFRKYVDLDHIQKFYQAVNIKLDKCGGLTEALECAMESKKRGLKIISGCMLGTSLSLAPQFYLAQIADYVDADCALLLREDIEHGMCYEGDVLYPPEPALWG
jgi:L-Ala-D/L-Glu epimerase